MSTDDDEKIPRGLLTIRRDSRDIITLEVRDRASRQVVVVVESTPQQLMWSLMGGRSPCRLVTLPDETAVSRLGKRQEIRRHHCAKVPIGSDRTAWELKLMSNIYQALSEFRQVHGEEWELLDIGMRSQHHDPDKHWFSVRRFVEATEEATDESDG